MTVVELTKDAELKQTDILHMSEIIASAIQIKTKENEINVNAKETILDSLANMLERMLTLDIDLSKQNKVEVINLLNKLNANKEYMQLVKGKNDDDLKNLQAASARFAKKSQSAFNGD